MNIIRKQSDKNWINDIIIYRNEEYRLYYNSRHSALDIFHNEIGVFYSNMLEMGLKIFYIKTSPKHKIKFTSEDYTFFEKNEKHLKDKYENAPFVMYRVLEHLPIPPKLKFVRDSQSEDLLHFYDDLVFESFFVISRFSEDLYHYDLLVAVKPNFDLNSFLKLEFKLINIDSILPLFNHNLSYIYMQSIFDYDKLSNYWFIPITEAAGQINDNTPLIEGSREKLNLENFLKEQKEKYGKDHFYLSKNCKDLLKYYYKQIIIKEDLMRNQRVTLEHSFKNFGWCWYTLNYYLFDDFNKQHGIQCHTYPTNNSFAFIQLEGQKPLAIVKPDGRIITEIDDLDWGCMDDLFLSFSFPFVTINDDISIPKKIYGSGYNAQVNRILKKKGDK